MLKRVSFILITLFLCLKGYSQSSIPLNLKTDTVLHLPFADHSDQVFSATPNDENPKISINKVILSFSFQSYFINIDDFAQDGFIDFKILCDVPQSAAKLSIGALAITFTDKIFALNFKKLPNSYAYFTKFKLNFSAIAGLPKKTKNSNLKPLTAYKTGSFLNYFQF